MKQPATHPHAVLAGQASGTTGGPAAPATVECALEIANRQRTKRIQLRLLRQIAGHLLAQELGLESWNLSLCLLAAPAMTRLNETFVGHAGSTDVITFDYSERSPGIPSAEPGFKAEALHGEIFICVDEALLQARRFGTSWPAEVVRYLVHGVLHLRGFDDLQSADRRRMKREENRLHRALAARFPLDRLASALP
jgi:rRNA maturation RNase YbeY